MARPEPREVFLVIDRHQSAFETYAVAAWFFFTLTCFVAATLFRALPLPLALAVALPAALVLIEVPVWVIGVLLTSWKGDHIRAQSIAFMVLLGAIALWLSTKTSWIRFVAWQFLGIMALNAVAAVIVFLLRGSIARLENAVGGATSER